VRGRSADQLGFMPHDRALPAFAWTCMLDGAGTTASEALRTYLVHAAPQEAKARLKDGL